MGLFRAALNWARKELDWLLPNPFEGRKLREPAGRARCLRPNEAEALLKAAEQETKAKHLAEFIQLGLYSGMRPGEMLELGWNRVDLPRNAI